MGFSVSASAAIIFISFLIAASTLYTAWDNTYTTVQAAREDWYELKLSQLNTLVGLNASVGEYSVSITNGYYNVTLYIQNSGDTLYVSGWSAIYDGKYATIYDVSDDNVGLLDYRPYLLPSESVPINVTNIKSDSTVHNLTVVFENGCWLRMSWHYTGSSVVLDGTSEGCPAEVG
ncbi:archaeal flagella-related protein F [Thermococcus kodakarensis KOD1]|uniref:Archaeal flagella-related protein F n=1 Tax=Thermococcus kodakarensis (strain ATCC BAA-918 / JCM 12380 / KOD1) TaxID=69014 RepID=Q5JEE7_THEKO|nr:flagellin [Thermococcus kodakarensis]WCN28162.1 flagellin [Thermococcus kodakarensis]WCN30460.1 flagellin [Thermococcus kodakarensis]BAD84234.1 archaeal flagella-related protein F [Thermococcus kodakarensis KOD1]